MPGDRRPLDGITVVDFTRHMAGPYATVTLADFGADVVKVESYPIGDPSRGAGAHFINGEAAPFLVWNRGKRSVCVDMRKRAGLEAVHELIRTADVLVENYRPGVADEIGIGYDAMHALNDRLVYCSVSAYGQEPHLAGFPGTDPVVQALSGVMSVTGEPDGRPVLVGVPIGDFTGAMLAVQAVMLGLFDRERSGQGQRVDVSMLYGLMSAWTTREASYRATGDNPQRFGGQHSVLVPFSVFETADGHVVAGSWGGDSWPKFCTAVDLPSLADDPAYATGAGRAANRDKLIGLLAERFRTRTTSEWEKRFRTSGALFAPILSFSDVLDLPQVRDAGLVTTLEHRRAGPVPHIGPAIKMSDTPGRLERAAPLLGEHTVEVLRGAGFDAAVIDQLVRDGVVLQALDDEPGNPE